VDAWVDAHAPKQANPFPPTDENVMDGSMTYDKNCALCHGSLKQPTSPMQKISRHITPRSDREDFSFTTLSEPFG